MKVVRETCVAGKTILRAIRVVTSGNRKNEKRNKKNKPTKDAVMKVNQRNAERDLTMKLNHNFNAGDLHVTLTYDGEEPTKEEARKEKDKFLRNLRNYCKKENIEFKRIDVTEFENKRIHHHIVMSKVDIDVINKYWRKGFVKISVLDESGNYKKLAEYLIKETSKTFRNPDNPNKRRFSCSRNIVTPVIKRERVSERELYRDIKPLKGYYVEEDSIRRYEHLITGAECLEYIMVSLDDKPRLKKWYKGQVCHLRNYPVGKAYAEEQMQWEGWNDN